MPIKHKSITQITYYILNSRLLLIRWQTTKTHFFLKLLQYSIVPKIAHTHAHPVALLIVKHLLTIFRTYAMVMGERKVSLFPAMTKTPSAMERAGTMTGKRHNKVKKMMRHPSSQQ